MGTDSEESVPPKKNGSRWEPLYHRQYFSLGLLIPRQVVPEGVVEICQ